MRKNFGSKPWCYPMPVFIVGTYDENGNPNAMNAAWGGIDYDDRVNICMGADHKTTQNLKASKAFTISMGTVDQLVACDYVGVESGLKAADKWQKTGWHAEKSEFVNAPVIKELPMTMECELVCYDEKECHLVGRIVNISADESILTDGKIDVSKLRPISFDPVSHSYLEVSTKVGNAFKDGLKLK